MPDQSAAERLAASSFFTIGRVIQAVQDLGNLDNTNERNNASTQ